MDLIAMITTLIVMSLFGIGILMILIIMGQERSEIEQIYDDAAQEEFIKEYNIKKQLKKKKRKERLERLKKRLLNLFKLWLIGGVLWKKLIN